MHKNDVEFLVPFVSGRENHNRSTTRLMLGRRSDGGGPRETGPAARIATSRKTCTVSERELMTVSPHRSRLIHLRAEADWRRAAGSFSQASTPRLFWSQWNTEGARCCCGPDSQPYRLDLEVSDRRTPETAGLAGSRRMAVFFACAAIDKTISQDIAPLCRNDSLLSWIGRMVLISPPRLWHYR